MADDDTPATPQRAYRSSCPNCGAAVDFRSAASPMAVCSYCHSTLLREGEALRRIGQSADLFDDHSPLQLGAAGRYQGAAFTLVGRLQVRYEGGTWNEWHALFDGAGEAPPAGPSGAPAPSADPFTRFDTPAPAAAAAAPPVPRSGWLSEDNGAHVFSFRLTRAHALPDASGLRVGASLSFADGLWSVASVATARVIAAEGELPFVPQLEGEYVVVDLRNTRGEVATLDYGGVPPQAFLGRSVGLEALQLRGLREDSARDLRGRSLACPSCGAALEPKLDSTQSIVCSQCRAVVDIAQGAGGDLRHYRQGQPEADGGKPLLPLGATGRLAIGSDSLRSWQVVGYVERCTEPSGGDDEQYFWREYLLYNRSAGFAFLVDADDGWSWVKPMTGVPEGRGRDVRVGGKVYREKERYASRTTHVLGEFYWHLEHDQRTEHVDYVGPGGARLNREQALGNHQEVTWSLGAPIGGAVLQRAFGLQGPAASALARDVAPTSTSAGSVLVLIVVGLLLLAVVGSLARCSRDECRDVRQTFGETSNEYRQCAAQASGSGVRSYGGSYGGFNTGGGGHK